MKRILIELKSDTKFSHQRNDIKIPVIGMYHKLFALLKNGITKSPSNCMKTTKISTNKIVKCVRLTEICSNASIKRNKIIVTINSRKLQMKKIV